MNIYDSIISGRDIKTGNLVEGKLKCIILGLNNEIDKINPYSTWEQKIYIIESLNRKPNERLEVGKNMWIVDKDSLKLIRFQK